MFGPAVSAAEGHGTHCYFVAQTESCDSGGDDNAASDSCVLTDYPAVGSPLGRDSDESSPDGPLGKWC
jgi:hypothetical protein